MLTLSNESSSSGPSPNHSSVSANADPSVFTGRTISLDPHDAPITDEHIAPVDVRVVDGMVIAELQCQVVHERHSQVLLAMLQETAREHVGRMVIDLSKVQRFTCAWINAMIALSALCEQLGGKMWVVGADAKSKELFAVTHLDKRVNFAGSIEQAVQHFSGATISPWRVALARLFDIPVSGRRAA